MELAGPSEVLLIGGRSGVGKSTIALEVSHLLAEAGVQHAVIEGDNLDLPSPRLGGKVCIWQS
ncbi:MAG TPA: adenylyl-sulfate kinase [Leifsonia sp.]|jgi:adenylylsulfate kinase-like enzyme|nr:adenylyl-sulfate kinase [Leifsonia sp.]